MMDLRKKMTCWKRYSFVFIFIVYLLLNKGILTESAFFSQMMKSVQQRDSLQVICEG